VTGFRVWMNGMLLSGIQSNGGFGFCFWLWSFQSGSYTVEKVPITHFPFQELTISTVYIPQILQFYCSTESMDRRRMV